MKTIVIKNSYNNNEDFIEVIEMIIFINNDFFSSTTLISYRVFILKSP
jgi:hypothetical protein